MTAFSTDLPVEAVVFDMDGTLVDSEGLYCDACIHTMSTHGISLTREDYYLRMAGRSEDVIDEMMHADLEGTVAHHSLRSSRFREFRRLRDLRGVPVMPGVLDLLDHFDRCELRMGVASAAEMHDIEGNLELAGIRHRFKTLASSGEVEATKPAPDVYLLAAERLGVAADRCLAFEDTNSGARAAIDAGMQTFMVPHQCEADHYVKERARGILSSLTEFLEALI